MSERNKDDEILADFEKDFRSIQDDEADIRREWVEDKKFTWTDDQWLTEEKTPGMEYITVNKVQTTVRQVTNDAMQNKLGLRVHPRDDKTAIRTAKVIQGMCRYIERQSRAEVAYQQAFEDAVAAGRGFFRILTRFRSEDSFEQEAYFSQVENALSVFFDKNSKEKDGSDALVGGFYERIPKSTFKRNWPDVAAQDVDNLGQDASTAVWGDKDTVLIAEYFRVEYESEDLYLVLPEGASAPVAVWETDAKKQGIDLTAPLNKRKSQRRRVMWYKVGCKTILERKVFPGKYIPIVPVIGRYTNIEGKRSFKGLTRYARSSQKMYNYARTKQREKLGLSTNAPWIGAEGSFEGHEAKWKLSNVRRYPYLEYKPTTLNGQFAPAPTRTPPIPVDQGLIEETGITSEEIKATTGIFDPGLGKSETDQSGKAVLALQRQGQTSTYDFTNNLVLSIAHGGRILVGIIPEIYDTAQAIQILGENDKEEVVRINDPEFVDAKTGKAVLYDVTKGDYVVDVDAGPSYATKRVEASESIMAFIGTAAGAAFGEISGDILAGAMDWEGAEELAERYRKFVAMKYPGLVEEKDEEGNPVKGPDPQTQAQLQQADQAIQEMQAKIAELTQALESKQIENDTKLEIAEMDNATRIHIAKINAKSAQESKDFAQELLELRAAVESHAKALDIAPDPAQAGQGATVPEPGPIPGEQMGGEMPPEIME